MVSSLLYRKLPEPEPTKVVTPVLPDTDPVIKVARPPDPTVTVPLPDNSKLPPVLVPAAVLVPALSNTAVLVALVVAMAAVTDRLLSAARLTVPLVRLMGLDTVSVLDAPVMDADTLPVPEMLLPMVVAAERTKLRLELLDKVTAPPVPRVPVVPPLPICRVPALTVVAPL